MGRAHRRAYVSPSLMGLFVAVNAGLAITTIGRSALTLEMQTLTDAKSSPPLPDTVLSSERTPGERSAAVKALASHMVESFCDELYDSRVNTKSWGTDGPLRRRSALVRFFHVDGIDVAAPHVGVAVEQVVGW